MDFRGPRVISHYSTSYYSIHLSVPLIVKSEIATSLNSKLVYAMALVLLLSASILTLWTVNLYKKSI